MCSLVIINAVQKDILPSLGMAPPDIVWDPAVALMKRIAAGERADGICAVDAALRQLADSGLVDADSIVPVVQAEFGIAVQEGMPRPKLQTRDDLVRLLLEVPSIVYSRAGASGIYFETLIDRLGVGDAVRAKSTVIPSGLTGEKVRDGSAALTIQQMSELRAVEGIQIVGPLPPECQQTTDFSAGVFRSAEDPGGARAFIATLTTDAAREAYVSRGLKPRF
jgi:molybdate transport system substrate-binding protein